jgi:HD-GYP domain-containing protein (c-di-GMP phosphodiesterase class II)
MQAQVQMVNKTKKIEESFKFQDMTRSKIIKSLEEGNLKNINIAYGLRKLIEEIISEISGAGSKFLNTLMIKSKDNYFVDHAINTTVLSIIIGKRYKFNKTELATLALGCFLHDVGKIIIDQISKDGVVDDQLYKEHTTFGYLLLKNDSSISPMEIQIVNQHHECQDGTGFPIGLRGQNLPPVKADGRETKGQIFRLAEICAVANAYDNFVLNPLNGEKLGPQEVIKKMMLGAGTLYNKDIVQTLSQVIAAFPVGSYVKIINIVDPALIGSFGVVAKINRDDLSKPVIIITTNKYKKKIKPIMIDTSKLKLIDLELVI